MLLNQFTPQDFAKQQAALQNSYGNYPDPTAVNAYGLNPFQAQQLQSFNQNNSFGFNMPSLKLGIDGLSALGGIWAANKGLQQAKAQFNFQKDITNANLNNSIKSYNTLLSDRIEARAAQQGNMSKEAVADYKRLNQLSR